MAYANFQGFEWLAEDVKAYLAGSSSNLVHRTGNETIGDVKTYSSSPLVPTPSDNDDSTKVANTEWVKGQFDGLHLPLWIGEGGIGTEFYVDGASGSDTTGDGSQSKPWKTINHACGYVCSNYNINSQTVHINVAAGEYGSVSLSAQTRTTGKIVIRPISADASVTISSASGAVVHRGGAWEIEDMAIALIVRDTITSGGARYIVRSDDNSAGGLTLRHCDLSFADNAPAGLSPVSSIRCLAAQGGRINIENKSSALSANWSGEKGNSSIHWLWASTGGIIDVRAATSGYTYNVSGSFSYFIRVQSQGQYTVGGSGVVATWNYDNTVTGGRYYVEGGGIVRTALASAADVPEYFPGNAAGFVDANSYSSISPSVSPFQRKRQFSATPHRSITLAQDTPASASIPYEISISGACSEIYVYITMPSLSAASAGGMQVSLSDETSFVIALNQLARTATAYSGIHIENTNGLYCGDYANNTTKTSGSNLMTIEPVFSTGTISKIGLWLAAADLPAGTTINVYRALEV